MMTKEGFTKIVNFKKGKFLLPYTERWFSTKLWETIILNSLNEIAKFVMQDAEAID